MPGEYHSITYKYDPLRQYYRNGSSYIDSKIKDIGSSFKEYLSAIPVYITLRTQSTVYGRSWEMAALMGLLGYNETYSGTVDIHGNTATFGAIPFIDTKLRS